MDGGILQNMLWAIVAALLTVIPSMLIYHANQKRKEGRTEAEIQAHRRQSDENQRQIQAQWGRHKDHSEKLAIHKTEIEVLKSKLEELPNGNDIREMLDKLENKITSQLNAFLERDRGSAHCTLPNCPLHNHTT